MKFLADMGVSVSTVRSLREAGHDSVFATRDFSRWKTRTFSTRLAQKAASY